MKEFHQIIVSAAQPGADKAQEGPGRRGTVAQRHVSAEKAGLFCALNPLTAATLGLLFLGERLTLPGVLGAGLIAAGFVLQSLPRKEHLPQPEQQPVRAKSSQFVR